MTSSDEKSKASCSYPPPLLTASRTYIGSKVREILIPRELPVVSNFITTVRYGKETEESSSSSKLLYDRFIQLFPDSMVIKLLKIYRFGPVTAKIRSFCLELLDSHLMDLEESHVGLQTKYLAEIKTLLNSCLFEQENSDHDFKLLSSIISRVSIDVFLAYIPWDELCSYIISISDDHKKTLTMFIDLPMVLDENFLMPLLKNDLHVTILKGLLNQDLQDEEDWCLYLGAGFNMALQLVNLQRKALACDMVYAIVKSVYVMVKVKRREIIVRKGLIKLAKKVRREALRFRESEHEVVTRLVSMIKSIDGISEVTKMAASMILEVLERYYMGGKGMDWGFVQSQTVLKLG